MNTLIEAPDVMVGCLFNAIDEALSLKKKIQ